MSRSDWFAAAFFVVVLSERMIATFGRRQLVPGQQRMRWSLYALYSSYLLIVAGSLAEYFVLRRSLALWATVTGLICYVVSVAVRTVAIRTLGRLWSLQIEIREGHKLIREGIYSYVRHPNYAAIVLEAISIPIVVNSWWTLALALATLVPVLMLRLRREEQALIEKFGDEYRSYQQEVGALWPKLPVSRAHPKPVGRSS